MLVCVRTPDVSYVCEASFAPLSCRYEECKEKLVPFLKKVGFNPKKDIHFMPCSGLTGANLKDPVPECPWYT